MYGLEAGSGSLSGVQLIFIYGPVAAGKLTVGRALARLIGRPLFHNHLVVDAVAAVFPFGSPDFCCLRDEFWMRTFETAAAAGRSLIFTFAPEPTVDPDFAARVQAVVERAGGSVLFVALRIDPEDQRARLTDPGRAEFGKLRSVALLETLRDDCDRCLQAMPPAALTIDTTRMSPADAADAIAALADR